MEIAADCSDRKLIHHDTAPLQRRFIMKSITTERLQKLQIESDDFLLVNTLDAEHFSKMKIPGSVNIPQSEDDFVTNVLEASGSKQKLVVTYCASEQCNSSATRPSAGGCRERRMPRTNGRSRRAIR
jgi:hypothetical protein